MSRRLPPTSDPTARVIAALTEGDCHPVKSGAGWAARCPSHEDSTASLAISKGEDGRTLLHCHAGCLTRDIADTLGMTLADLFPRTDRAHRRGTGTAFPQKPAPGTAASDWNRLVADLAQTMPSDRLMELASQLGVSPSSLTRLGLGWAEQEQLAGINGKARGPGWVFPMRDPAGQVVGLSVRMRDGAKWTIRGGRLGLFVPVDLAKLPDPVLAVEGASDTAAAVTAGWAAVGRPSNKAGTAYLAELLRSREVIVCGENDQKADGRWPGREGASSIAKGLAAAWSKPVRLALPPPPHKDLRAWLSSLASGGPATGSAIPPPHSWRT